MTSVTVAASTPTVASASGTERTQPASAPARRRRCRSRCRPPTCARRRRRPRRSSPSASGRRAGRRRGSARTAGRPARRTSPRRPGRCRHAGSCARIVRHRRTTAATTAERRRPMDAERSTSGWKRAARVLGEEYVTRALSGDRQLQPRVPAARHRVLLGRGVGPLGADRPPAQPQQPVPARRAEPAGGVQDPLPGAPCATAARSTSCATRCIQITVYAGVPAGVEAFRLARQVLDAEGITPEPAP